MCFRDPGTEASRSWDKAACFLLFIPTVFLSGRKAPWEGKGAVGSGEGGTARWVERAHTNMFWWWFFVFWSLSCCS